jgi:hypothetical protein
LPSFGYQVRYAHFITKTPRQKNGYAVIWLCPPTTQSKKTTDYHIEQNFVEKYLKAKSINSEKSCIFAVTK